MKPFAGVIRQVLVSLRKILSVRAAREMLYPVSQHCSKTKQEYVGAFAGEITSTAKYGCRPIESVVDSPNQVGQYLAGTVF